MIFFLNLIATFVYLTAFCISLESQNSLLPIESTNYDYVSIFLNPVMFIKTTGKIRI